MTARISRSTLAGAVGLVLAGLATAGVLLAPVKAPPAYRTPAGFVDEVAGAGDELASAAPQGPPPAAGVTGSGGPGARPTSAATGTARPRPRGVDRLMTGS